MADKIESWYLDEEFCKVAQVTWPEDYDRATRPPGARLRRQARQRLRLRWQGYRLDFRVERPPLSVLYKDGRPVLVCDSGEVYGVTD